MNDGSYRFTLDGGAFVLDAADPERSNWLRYINHSRAKANVRAIPTYALGINYGMVFQAERPIDVGEEVLLDYGTSHWDEFFPWRLDPRRLLIDYVL